MRYEHLVALTGKQRTSNIVISGNKGERVRKKRMREHGENGMLRVKVIAEVPRVWPLSFGNIAVCASSSRSKWRRGLEAGHVEELPEKTGDDRHHKVLMFILVICELMDIRLTFMTISGVEKHSSIMCNSDVLRRTLSGSLHSSCNRVQSG